MGEERLFGTDGIRGRPGRDPIFEAGNLRRLAGAVSRVALGEEASPLVILADDGRASAAQISLGLVPPLVSAGATVREVGLLTTPGLSYLVRSERARLGVMISASHNPPTDNGIKLFGPTGEKLPDAVERAIEAAYREGGSPAEARGGWRLRDPALAARVVEHLVGRGGRGLDLSRMQIGIDAANGGGSRIASAVFRGLGAEVVSLHDAPDGRNINVDCGALHPASLAETVRRLRLHLGLALDGDGDRAVFVDDAGSVVDGDVILLGLARDAHARGALAGGILVATVMSNGALRGAVESFGARLEVVPVGDRAVVERLRDRGASLGGEASGHVVFGAENDYTGDGIYTGLRVVEALRRTGRALSSWGEGYRPFPSVLRNVPVRSRPPLESLPAVAGALREARSRLGEAARILLRYSGTEDLARVFVEGPDARAVAESAEAIAGSIARALS
jgi:phosphoglucosamine mutase